MLDNLRKLSESERYDIAGQVFGLIVIIAVGAYFCSALYASLPSSITNIFQTPSSILIERLGIFLQLLAGFSVLPELIGEGRLDNAEKSIQSMNSSARGILTLSNNRTILMQTPEGVEPKHLPNGVRWLFVFMAMISFIFFVGPLTRISNGVLTGDFIGLCLLPCLFPLWIGLSLFMADGIIMVTKLILSFSIHMFPFRRLVQTVTFPLFVVGTLLQLIATFIPS